MNFFAPPAQVWGEAALAERQLPQPIFHAPKPEAPPAMQQIFTSPDGRILDSCDSIFPAQTLAGQRLPEIFPLLEPCWQWLAAPESAQFDEMQLPGAHLELGGQTGVFDLNFMKIWYGGHLAIYCLLTERTEHYQHLQRTQQARNEQLMAKQSKTRLPLSVL